METPLATWLSRFLQDLSDVRRCSEHTLAAYRRDLERFLTMQSLTEKPPTDRILRPGRFQDFLAGLAVAGLSNRSIARAAASLRSFLSFLHRRGATPSDWSDRVPSVKFAANLPRFVNETQMLKWLSAMPSRTRWERRDRAIMVFLYATGARLSELVGTNWRDIDSGTATIRLFGKRSRERISPAGSALTDALALLRAETPPDAIGPDKPVFVNRAGGRLTGRSVARIVKRSFSRNIGGDISPHKLRHTFATHMLDHGADLMALKELLGHQNVATTQIYTHTTPQRLARIYRDAFPVETAAAGGGTNT